jgi:hypothetical protein
MCNGNALAKQLDEDDELTETDDETIQSSEPERKDDGNEGRQEVLSRSLIDTNHTETSIAASSEANFDQVLFLQLSVAAVILAFEYKRYREDEIESSS